MGQLKYRVRFPCGYEEKIEGKSFTGLGDIERRDECPLHGKNCILGFGYRGYYSGFDSDKPKGRKRKK